MNMGSLLTDRAIFRWSRMARVLFWLSVVAIMILSLLPGNQRPHTSAPGLAEHFAAYAAAGCLLALGYRDWRRRLLAWVGLAIASGVFEILQGFIPGRGPAAIDALASTGGLTVGLMAMALPLSMLKLSPAEPVEIGKLGIAAPPRARRAGDLTV
jgi:VanZ family protein